jgi:hypothetical protein
MTPEFGALIQELEGIRLILYAAVILLFVWVFVVVVRSLVMATKHLRANSFETEANHLLEEGAYERLISLAQRTLEHRSGPLVSGALLRIAGTWQRRISRIRKDPAIGTALERGVH